MNGTHTLTGPRRLIAGVVGALLCCGGVLRWIGDRHDGGMLFLYAPRAWLAIPVVLLVVLLGWRRWTHFVAATVAGVGYLAVVGGLEWPSLEGNARSGRIRVLTWNTDGVPAVAGLVRATLARWRLDFAVLLDCTPALVDSLRAIPGLTVRASDDYCVASPHMITGATILRSPRGVGRFGHAARYQVVIGTDSATARRVDVVALHLASPRTALSRALRLDFSGLEEDRYWRHVESERIRAWVDDAERAPGVPLIVAGDFNLPPESRVLRRDWGDFRNAFSDAGWGFGYTMFRGPVAVRIDHILYSPELRAARAWVERGFPSEHQPLLAEMTWAD